MGKITLTIDGEKISVPRGTSVLEAARLTGVKIPSLCYLKGVNTSSSCRVCMVEVGRKLHASCSLIAEEGMVVNTNTPAVRESRKMAVELLLSNHKCECTVCIRNGNCELQRLAGELNIKNIRYTGKKTSCLPDDSSFSVVRDPEKCLLCGRCISVCQSVQTVSAIGYANRGFDTVVSAPYFRSLKETDCVNCGQCVMSCPVGALYEKESISDVWNALKDQDKYVVVQTAPAVRVALGEEFGMPVGTRVTGKMVAALRRLGFDRVFDTDFAADVTIMEEGTELLSRLKSQRRLPLLTSCCPGWVTFVEEFYPELIPNLSSCKSPHEMEGALIKSYFAEKEGINQEKIIVVSIMPCVAKKYESQRGELSHDGFKDVDIVLTTRELARMIKESGIDFVNLENEEFDRPFGKSTGAGVIFAASGGVLEAALRTVSEICAGKELDRVDFEEVRGFTGIKEAEVVLGEGQAVKAAVAHGLGNVRKLLESIKAGEKEYDFVEVMACPGGCITGGGQPIVDPALLETIDIKAERSRGIYREDQDLPLRKSHQNPCVKSLYQDFLGKPNGLLSHKLLHTGYEAKAN